MAREIVLTQFSPTWMGGNRNCGLAHQVKLWKAPETQLKVPKQVPRFCILGKILHCRL